MNSPALFRNLRTQFHTELKERLWVMSTKGPTNADNSNKLSREIASGIAEKLGPLKSQQPLSPQAQGDEFEDCVKRFIESAFVLLDHLRPGKWKVAKLSSRGEIEIANYQQYAHLREVDKAVKSNQELSIVLGNDYMVSPDIVIARETEPDAGINTPLNLVDDGVASRSVLRKKFFPLPILHASISCKWTVRSDRAQNARLEALNLIRNRKGKLPHVVLVLGEPLPSRLASIALGTGDIDCVYHFALPELMQTVKESRHEDAKEMLSILVEGSRLKDISDLPLDLAT